MRDNINEGSIDELLGFLAMGQEGTEKVEHEDIKKFRESAASLLYDYGLPEEIPENVEKVLQQAQDTGDAVMRAELLQRASAKLEIYCLAKGSKWSQPVSEEVKAELKARRDEHAEVRRASAASSGGQRRGGVAKPAPTRKATKKPVWQDPEEQAKKLAARPWIKPGSFKPDPENESKTNCVIICQAKLDGCEGEREIHLADSFQCKRCVSCQKKFKGSSKKDA